MTDATKLLLTQARYIRDYDACAARIYPQAAAIVARVGYRVEARYDRNRFQHGWVLTLKGN